jgi:rhodanese-related sulfurtransferase
MRNARAVVLETMLVAALGLAFALAANALSPRGLRLSRNYFPGNHKPIVAAPPGAHSSSAPTTGTSANRLSAVLERLRQQNLQSVTSNEVIELFRDPRYELGVVVFVDARNDQEYQAGHIPRAWQFNHYRAEAYLPTVLPVCLTAEKIVVYCNGGECEDSEFAAVVLRDAGVPRENLFVYVGGISEWMTNGLPVETGARGDADRTAPPQ